MIGRVTSPTEPIKALALAPQPMYRPMAKELVATHTRRGEKVMILLPEGYRIAYELGLDNVAPYEMQNAVVTLRQMRTVIETIEREGVRTVFTPAPGGYLVGDAEAAPEQMQMLRQAGFVAAERGDRMIAWRKAD
jgi:hypothetical protein